MPPAAKFTRGEIAQAALAIVRRDGPGALTARSLATELKSSPRPIFTVFESVDDVRRAVLDAARELYASYVSRGLAEDPPFKGAGLQYIRFAAEEPMLFRLLFLSPKEPPVPIYGVLPAMDENYERILDSLTDYYGLTREEGEALYGHLGVYSHGLATLIASKLAEFAPDEISRRLTEVFTGLLAETKRRKKHD